MEFNELYKYKFKIKNLGFVEQGEIEIKPLTILCGSNNTGKTWVMYALYGCLSSLPASLVLPGLSEVVNKLKEEGAYSWNLEEWLDHYYEDVLEVIHEGCKKRLERVFNVEDDFFEKSRFDWILEKDDLINISRTKGIDFRLEIGKKHDALRVFKEDGSSIAQFTLLADKLPDLSRFISIVIIKFLVESSVDKSVFLIPAERNGLHLFFRELSSRRSALLHHASNEDFDLHELIRDVIKSRYAEPIADYIDWLNDIRNFRNKKSDDFRQVADNFRRNTLGGRYVVDSEGAISFTLTKPRKQPAIPKMPLHLASSTIKSLFGLLFFLSHMAKKGDVLMIDEPELNLHPGAQRRIARLLAALSNAGLTIIVSTHSDYFIREINSLIMLSQKKDGKEKIMGRFGYKESEILNVDDVAAYVFDKRQVSKMKTNSEEGVLAETFDSVINDLNETSDDIYYFFKS